MTELEAMRFCARHLTTIAYQADCVVVSCRGVTVIGNSLLEAVIELKNKVEAA